MIVRFSDVDELLAELDQRHVVHQAVRVTTRRRNLQAGIQRLDVVVTAKVHAAVVTVAAPADYDLYLLERHVGDLWGLDGEKDGAVVEKANKAAAAFRQAIADHGFAAASGVYELAAA